MAEEPVLTLSGISKSFGELSILRSVDMKLSEAESVAILGPSGAGKSTLLHIAGLMERPTAGDVFLSGREAGRMSERERDGERLNQIGFLFQFHHLLPDFNVLDNVLMPARLAKDDLKTAEAKGREMLLRLGLENRLAHLPSQLSGGEQQRAALARALIRGPKLLLCDEPTGNLDEQTAQSVIELIWSEVKRSRVAAVVVTHNERLARLTDRAFHLSNGNFKETR